MAEDDANINAQGQAFEDSASPESTVESSNARLPKIVIARSSVVDVHKSLDEDWPGSCEASLVDSEAETEIKSTDESKAQEQVAFLQWMSHEVEKEMQSKSSRRQSWCVGEGL
jgi:hypothetical protein